jgi:hypothetical protein
MWTITIDDRYLLLALDRMYRDAMQEFERSTLLPAARKVARRLWIRQANVPVEGYYSADRRLSQYFRLMRALQEAPESSEPAVAPLPAFRLLARVCASPVFGRPVRSGGLLPRGWDPLTQALRDSAPDWTLARLVPAARAAALARDDFSLVGLAALIEDGVVLAALRESVVLYAALYTLGGPPKPAFVWRVSPELAVQANRFVRAFNEIVAEGLPAIVPENAHLFFDPTRPFADIVGRCVRVGVDPDAIPVRHYHWAICKSANGELRVQEFWSPEIWTTKRFVDSLAATPGTSSETR